MTERNLVHALSEDEIRTFLAGEEYGRLAFSVANIPEIVPINYVVRDDKLYFMTNAGSKLLGVTINQHVAFETDRVSDNVATSIVLAGMARELQTREELEFAATLGLQPWIAAEKYHYVEIAVTEMTGRRFQLDR